MSGVVFHTNQSQVLSDSENDQQNRLRDKMFDQIFNAPIESRKYSIADIVFPNDIKSKTEVNLYSEILDDSFEIETTGLVPYNRDGDIKYGIMLFSKIIYNKERIFILCSIGNFFEGWPDEDENARINIESLTINSITTESRQKIMENLKKYIVGTSNLVNADNFKRIRWSQIGLTEPTCNIAKQMSVRLTFQHADSILKLKNKIEKKFQDQQSNVNIKFPKLILPTGDELLNILNNEEGNPTPGEYKWLELIRGLEFEIGKERAKILDAFTALEAFSAEMQNNTVGEKKGGQSGGMSLKALLAVGLSFLVGLKTAEGATFTKETRIATQQFERAQQVISAAQTGATQVLSHFKPSAQFAEERVSRKQGAHKGQTMTLTEAYRDIIMGHTASDSPEWTSILNTDNGQDLIYATIKKLAMPIKVEKTGQGKDEKLTITYDNSISSPAVKEFIELYEEVGVKETAREKARLNREISGNKQESYSDYFASFVGTKSDNTYFSEGHYEQSYKKDYVIEVLKAIDGGDWSNVNTPIKTHFQSLTSKEKTAFAQKLVKIDVAMAKNVYFETTFNQFVEGNVGSLKEVLDPQSGNTSIQELKTALISPIEVLLKKLADSKESLETDPTPKNATEWAELEKAAAENRVKEGQARAKLNKEAIKLQEELIQQEAESIALNYTKGFVTFTAIASVIDDLIGATGWHIASISLKIVSTILGVALIAIGGFFGLGYCVPAGQQIGKAGVETTTSAIVSGIEATPTTLNWIIGCIVTGKDKMIESFGKRMAESEEYKKNKNSLLQAEELKKYFIKCISETDAELKKAQSISDHDVNKNPSIEMLTSKKNKLGEDLDKQEKLIITLTETKTRLTAENKKIEEKKEWWNWAFSFMKKQEAAAAGAKGGRRTIRRKHTKKSGKNAKRRTVKKNKRRKFTRKY